jgi:endonuclease G
MSLSFRASVCAALAFSASTAFAAFDGCRQFFPEGHVPQLAASAPAQRRDLCFSGFAVLHSGQSKTPLYVVERLDRERLSAARGLHRSDRFYEEARLPSAQRAHLADYRGSDFDRGHQAPAADMADPESMAQSFSLANMVPQAREMNRKPWADIEKATRKYVMRARGEVFVFTGPVFADAAGQPTIGPGRVWVPMAMFKLVYDASTHRAWAHWMQNSDGARVGRPISYPELVRRTGTHFLNGVPVAGESED